MGKYAIVVALLVGLSNSAFARDDGRYANDPLKHWFDNLTSSNGNCCSFADGLSISDVDWDTKDGHYRVLLHGEWINVPNSAVVTEPNRYGPAVVWPYMDTDGNIYIRCFCLEAARRASCRLFDGHPLYARRGERVGARGKIAQPIPDCPGSRGIAASGLRRLA